MIYNGMHVEPLFLPDSKEETGARPCGPNPLLKPSETQTVTTSAVGVKCFLDAAQGRESHRYRDRKLLWSAGGDDLSPQSCFERGRKVCNREGFRLVLRRRRRTILRSLEISQEVIAVAVQGNLGRAGISSAPGLVYALTGLGVVAIWVSVTLAMIYAPDMITGTQHDHLPIVGWTYWIWGLIATGSVILAAQRGIRAKVSAAAPWLAFAIAVAVVWIGVMLVSIFAPVFVTGTDPTTLPLAAMVVPVVGVILTGLISKFFETAFEP